MIVVGSCYFLLTLLTSYDQNIDFCFPLKFKLNQFFLLIMCHVVSFILRKHCINKDAVIFNDSDFVQQKLFTTFCILFSKTGTFQHKFHKKD